MAAFAKILLSIVDTFLKGINLYRWAERQERELAAQYFEIAHLLGIPTPEHLILRGHHSRAYRSEGRRI
jgi:hypothetical protein